MFFETIRAADIFRYRINGKCILIDLRDNSKYCMGHIPSAINIPYQDLQNRLPELKTLVKKRSEKNQPAYVILYCDRGNTSLLASRDLYKEGFCIKNVYGGMQNYRGPLVRGCRPK